MRRGLLLDRDGIINLDRGYVGHRDQFEFTPGLFPFLRAVEDSGYRLAILTNQSGVARGLYTEQDFHDLTAWMSQECRQMGVTIDLVLTSYEHPEAKIPAYARESFWRKPNPGMVLEGVQRLRLDPAQSAFLGDQPRDMEAAKAGGIATRLLMSEMKDAGDGVIMTRTFDDALKALIT